MVNAKPNIVGINGNIGSGKDTVADRFVQKGYVKISLADPMKRFAYKVFEFNEEQLWGPSDHRNAEDSRFHANSDAWRSAERRVHSESISWLRDLFPAMGEDGLYSAQDSLIDWFYKLQHNHATLSPRVCLQLLGTEWGREACSQNVWVDYTARTAARLLGSSDKSDVNRWYDRLYGLHRSINDSVVAPKGVVVPDVRFENELQFFKRNDYPVVRVVRPETDYLATGVGITKHKSETEQEGFDLSLFSAIIENTGTLEALLATADGLASSYSTK